MIASEWLYNIESRMPFIPTEGQHEAIECISRFLADRTPQRHSAMILRGSAGTGKTSVARALVCAMTDLKQKVVLLAPTGRAAKVFSLGTGCQAHTIHRKIYRQRSYLDGRFMLNQNLHADTLFIVDEASMINSASSSYDEHSTFGSGNLLDDLVQYVYGGRNCALMLIGDIAQLPPVGCDESPALVASFVAGYGLDVSEYDLLEVLRQAEGSGILVNATKIRHMITYDRMTELPKIRFAGFDDISICHGAEIIEQLASSYSHAGMDETIVVTKSNKRANIYNNGIRNQVLGREEEIASGDRLMIVKNNYFWTKDSADENTPAFLANGDHCIVRRVRNMRELYGFRFADITIEFPDYDNYELQVTAILDTLQSEAPALTREEQELLYNNVLADYAHITVKRERMEKMRNDIYFNALQVKYAYAVTCHKAQGGQWEHVYLDQGYMTDDMLTPSYIHWLYTAFTRATNHLYLVNWRQEQTEAES